MSQNHKSSLIPKVKKEDKERLMINVPGDVSADARSYAEYVNGDLSYVFTGALRYIVSRDTAFQEWRKPSKPHTQSPTSDVAVAPPEKTPVLAEPVLIAHPEPALARKPRIA